MQIDAKTNPEWKSLRSPQNAYHDFAGSGYRYGQRPHLQDPELRQAEPHQRETSRVQDRGARYAEAIGGAE